MEKGVREKSISSWKILHAEKYARMGISVSGVSSSRQEVGRDETAVISCTLEICFSL